MKKRYWNMLLLSAVVGIGLPAATAAAETKALDGNGVQVQFDEETGNVVLYGYRANGEKFQMSRPSQVSYPVVEGSILDDFTDFTCQIEEEAEGTAGAGGRMTVSSRSAGTGLIRICELETVDEVEGLLHIKTSYRAGAEEVEAEKFIDCEFALFAPEQTVWSYNGGGEGPQSRYDTLQKITLDDEETFYRANRQDETSVGVPAADIYSASGGITVGDASATRRILQTPVAEKDHTVYAAIQRPSCTIEAQETLAAGEGFVHVHNGDYYMGLRGYAEGMRRIGFETLSREEIPDSSYDLRWESWGWEFAWTLDLVLGKLDELQELGIKQVTLDDGWYINAGEWNLNAGKLPNGDADMKRLTDAIHEKGMTALLWWRPCDGGREESALYKEHQDYFVQNENGSIGKLAGPGAFNQFSGTAGYALCPASEGAVQSQVDFVKKALTEWGFDGLKSDYVWSIPKCCNPAHKHERPEESTEQQAVFYREVYQAMRECKPDAFHLLCNCGTPQDYYSLPYVTQIPTADPTSVDQTRRRVKAYKALAGDYFPVTTDHNYLWYPSTVGTGAVFIEKRNMEGAEQADYERWLKIAQEVELQKGEFIGDLYSYGFDPYETYVVNKDGVMYYAFYRDGEHYRPQGNPEVELKGLKPDRMYRIVDYVNDRTLATNVPGNKAVLAGSFSSYLLVRAEELSVPDFVPNPAKGEISAEETDPELVYEGSWTAEQNAGASGGGCKYTQEASASVSFRFQGDSIAWYGQKDINFGSASVYIDDVLEGEISCSGTAELGVKLYEKTGLDNGWHTIKIVCKSPAIDIDRFVYTRQEDDSPDAITSVSQCISNYQEDTFAQGAGWDAFEAAKKRLSDLAAGNADRKELEQAKKEVLDAALALRKVVDKELLSFAVPYPEEVETTETDLWTLYYVMLYAENLDMERVIPAVRTRCQNALEKAKRVFADPIDQNEINRAWAELLDAVQFTGFTMGDKTELKKTLNECRTIDLSTYQNAQALRTLMDAVERLLLDENALEAEVQQALGRLTEEKTKALQEINAGAGQNQLPGQVQGIKIVSQTKKLQISWQQQPDASSYIVFIQKDGIWQTAGTATGSAFTVSNLKTAKKYQIKIAASNAAGTGKESEIVYTATKPSKPKIKSVKNYKTTGIQVACKKSGETGFEIWVKKGKKAFKKAASGSKTITVKKGVRGSKKVSVKIRGYVKNKNTKVYGAFKKIKIK